MYSSTRHTISRRRFAGTLLAGAAASTAFSVPLITHARQSGSASGELVEWGFGVQETNPLARARVLAFQEAYPDVDLTIVESFDEQKLLTAAASDTLPDVIWLSRFETATWAARGVLQPLTEYIERDNYDTSVFYEQALDEATFEGEIYGIPGGSDVRALFVNIDHLEQAGVSVDDLDTSDWDALAELAGNLVIRDGDTIQTWGFDHKVQADNFWLWGMGNGGSFLSEDATEATFNHEANVEALDWAYRTYENQGGLTDYRAVSSSWQGDEQFAREQVAMTLYEQWMVSGPVATVAPDLNFKVLPVRENGSGPDGDIASYSGGNAWYITSDAKNPDAAWEFIAYMHSDETWQIGAHAVKDARESEGRPYFPSFTGKITADDYQFNELYEPVGPAFDEAVEVFSQIAEVSRNREISNSPVAGQLQDILRQDGVEPALGGNMSAQDALDQANEAAQDAIDMF